MIDFKQRGVGLISRENFVEEWKPLIYKGLDLTDRFLVSNTGKLYSKVSNKILKTHINKEGYVQVCVSLGSQDKKKVLKIHIAVACMFCDGYKDNLTVNHKDGNKTNNNSYNLEWISYKGNMEHAADNGLLNIVGKKPVKQIDKDTGEVIEIFESISAATRKFGKSKTKNLSSNISDAMLFRNGRSGLAYGYKWEYC